MSDATIQARLQTILQALDEFDDEDVTLGDFRVMDRGSPPYAVIVPGPFSASRNMPDANTSTIWTLYIDLIERFLDDSYAPIVSIRQTVKDELDGKPALNSLSGVIHALVSSGEAMRYLYPRGGSDVPQFVLARLVVEVFEFPAGGT